MPASLEFLIGLLEEDEPFVASEDLDGIHAKALKTWQAMGFLKSEPMANPIAGCPYCGEGVQYRIGERFICNVCRCVVDLRHLLSWPLDREAFLAWFAERLRLRGGVRRIEDRLWQLGTWEAGGDIRECFFRRAGVLTDVGSARLSAYRRALVFYGNTKPPELEKVPGSYISLLELLQLSDALTINALQPLFGTVGRVRFEAHSGALWVGDDLLGEIPVGNKEWAFLQCLVTHIDHFVPYADLKEAVLRATGSKETTEEATFCHRLKNRIKEKGWIPKIDLLLATTNKGEGYRLRGQIGSWGES